MIRTLRLPTGTRDRVASLRAAVTVAGVLTFAACAAPQPAPNEAIQAAELAIASAEQARVADHASAELGTAREKLTAARAAIAQEDMVLAGRLADESRADAELATAKAEEVRTRSVNDDMRKSTETLKQEMQRNEGARQ